MKIRAGAQFHTRKPSAARPRSRQPARRSRGCRQTPTLADQHQAQPDGSRLAGGDAVDPVHEVEQIEEPDPDQRGRDRTSSPVRQPALEDLTVPGGKTQIPTATGAANWTRRRTAGDKLRADRRSTTRRQARHHAERHDREARPAATRSRRTTALKADGASRSSRRSRCRRRAGSAAHATSARSAHRAPHRGAAATSPARECRDRRGQRKHWRRLPAVTRLTSPEWCLFRSSGPCQPPPVRKPAL